MTIDEVEKIKTVVENKDYIVQLVNTVAKTLIEAFENLKIEDVNMFQLGYSKAIDDFERKLTTHFADWELSNTPCNDDETDRMKEIICETIENAIGGVEEIAEQLKAGDRENGK